jgi:hypothetical protein
MAGTHAIDDNTLSPAEIEMLVYGARRNPDARLHGLAQAQQASHRISMALGGVAAAVWATNAFLILSSHSG